MSNPQLMRFCQKMPGILFFSILLLQRLGYAQMTGIPFVDAYPKEEYGFGTQNWDIDQGEDGLLYFANNEGLLEFDGTDWRLFSLPNRTILRAILIREGRIYAGGQNEFGVYRPDIREKWRYSSLKERIPEEHRNFEDVWAMEALGETIYFLASGKIFILREDTCRVLDDRPIRFFAKAGKTLFAQDRNGVLYTLQGDTLAPVPGSEQFNKAAVRAVLAQEEHFLIATHKRGLFRYDSRGILRWPNEGEKRFDPQFTNTADVLDNGEIVLGTGFKGVVMMEPDGRFKYRVSTDDGLANNRVICTFVDRQNNLWLGLDNGISMVRTNSPFSRIYPRGELEGAGYDVAIVNNKIYLGVSSGLLYADWSSKPTPDDLQLVPGTKGQVWGLDVIDDRLLLSHQDGAFLIQDNKAERFFEETGVWLFTRDQYRDDLIISGNYRGISIFERESLAYRYDIPGLSESSRFIEQDRWQNYWMAHPYRGVYRIRAPHDPARRRVDLLGPDQGLPSALHNHVFKINGEMLICAEKGVFTFDEMKNTFLPYEPVNQYLGTEGKVRRLFEGPAGDIWFITEQEIGVLDVEEQGLTRTISKKVFPELLPLMNSGWERIYPYDENHVFISTINGFVHYDNRHSPSVQPRFEVVLHEMVVNKDSTLYPAGTGEELTFSHRQNSFLFNVSATEYVNNGTVQFQYWLKGFDENWTPPGNLKAKEYTNLPFGEYELNVRAVNISGDYSPVYALKFTITRPWYASGWTLAFLSLLFLLSVFFIYRRIRKKYKALQSEVDSTKKKSKAEIQRLETEKIQAELDHKKRELVSATLHLVQKNETIAGIVNKLSEIRKNSREEKVKRQLQKLMHSLKKGEVMDEGWDQVMYHFNELHEDFFERLKKEYPALTPKDLRICAYLKMNLTSKEMASLMNISLRGVEASRYRLRKKMELSSEVNLTEFFMGGGEV